MKDVTPADNFAVIESFFRTMFRHVEGKSQRFIYLVWNVDRETAKIGFSKNPAKRFRELRAASPDDLKFVGSIPGGRKAKAVWKIAMAASHIKGDWFSTAGNQILHRFIMASLEADGIA